MKLLSNFAVPGVLTADLGSFYTTYSDANPAHTCAVFTHAPNPSFDMPNYKEIPDSWIYKIDCSRIFDCVYIVCIEKSAHGDWVERNGDGGYENWLFNAVFFRRDDRRLIVI